MMRVNAVVWSQKTWRSSVSAAAACALGSFCLPCVVCCAQKPPNPSADAAPPAALDASAIAEAAREAGETLYQGVITGEGPQKGVLVFLVDRLVLPNGKTQTVSPARRKTIRLPADVILRSADSAGLTLTHADLIPGASVFVLGTPAAAAAKQAETINARAIMVPLDGGDVLPGNLLKPWSQTQNWTFRANTNAAPGSEFLWENGTIHIKVGGTPIREWHAQIFQQFAGTSTIAPNTKYTLRFQARASTNHFVTIGSQTDDDGPYRNIGLLQTVLLTPRWQVYQYTFTTFKNATGALRMPVFSAGHRGGDVYLANVALVAGELPLPPFLQAEQTRQTVPNTNLITNANDANAWLLYSEKAARGSLTQATEPSGGKVLKITVSSASTQPYHFQLLRPALPLVEGRTYELRFLARANAKRTLNVEGQTNIGDFHNIGLSKMVDLDTTWKEYVVGFTAKNVVAGFSRAPQFCFGQAEGTVWLANVSLKMLPQP